MYMKKSMIIGFISIVFASVLLSSCDLLDLTPKAAVTVKTYFKNESELELYANRFYSDILPGGSGIYKEIGDNMIWIPLASEVSLTRTVPEKGGGWSFEALRHINFLLENISNCPDAAAVRKYTGVAKFFRAHYYFNMVKRFGDVPWLDHVPGTDDPALYKARDSRDFVMEKVIEDLDEAIRLFKKENSTKDLYHVTWWTAMALKSRICLFEGTFRKYHGLADSEKWLRLCVESSDALMNATRGYSLYTSGTQPYRDLFTSDNAKSVEVILARDYDQSASLPNYVLGTFNTPGEGRCGFTKKFVNSYLMADGTRFTDKPDYDKIEFVNEVSGRDPRLAQTIRTTKGLNFSNCITGYQPHKYIAEANLNSNAASYNDLPLFRMAEIYLNYAEAKAELGEITQGDLDISVNKIRARAKMPDLNLGAANDSPDPYLSSAETGYTNVTGANKGVILEIRRERTIELVLESQNRWWDLMRWKEGACIGQKMEGIYIPADKIGKAYDVNGDGNADICVYSGAQPSVKENVTWFNIDTDYKLSGNGSGKIVFFSDIVRKWNEERDYFYPIPKEDIILTGGKIEQNKGW